MYSARLACISVSCALSSELCCNVATFLYLPPCLLHCFLVSVFSLCNYFILAVFYVARTHIAQRCKIVSWLVVYFRACLSVVYLLLPSQYVVHLSCLKLIHICVYYKITLYVVNLLNTNMYCLILCTPYRQA